VTDYHFLYTSALPSIAIAVTPESPVAFDFRS
jgi:hypothetical protein